MDAYVSAVEDAESHGGEPKTDAISKRCEPHGSVNMKPSMGCSH